MGYRDRYNKEHYKKIWIRSETYGKLSKVCDKPLMDCIDELVELIHLPDRIFSELKERLLDKYSGDLNFLRLAGGDWKIKDELVNIAVRVPLRKATFVEVFGGSGVMSQYVPRSKFPNVIYNDIDRDLASLHELVKSKPDLLASILLMLPYSRYIYRYIYENLAGSELGGLIGASVFAYILLSSFSATFAGGFSTAKIPRSNARKYISHVMSIYETCERLRDVTIENLDFEKVIKKYDSSETLFYLDPPYVSVGDKDRERYYRHGFTAKDATRLSSILKNIKGYFMLKIHPDNEVYYKNLNINTRIPINKMLDLSLPVGGKRKQLTYLILTNYKLSEF